MAKAKPGKCPKCKSTEISYYEYYEHIAYHDQVVRNGYVYLEDAGNNDTNCPTTGRIDVLCRKCGHEWKLRNGNFDEFYTQCGRIDMNGKIKWEPEDDQ